MTVIGPINQTDWNYVRSLKSDIKFMKTNPNLGDFKKAVAWEEDLYDKYLSSFRAPASGEKAA